GHVAASRLAGVHVKAVVLAPHGGATIRASAQTPPVDFLTALAGPLANALAGAAGLALLLSGAGDAGSAPVLIELGALQLITAAVNLVPRGPMDGQRMLAALRGARNY